MTLLTAEKISKRFNDRIIFEDVSFTIKTGDKIGLIGKNGSGKTTLFNIIDGVKNPDQGNIYKNKKCLINYAQQEKTQYLEMTLFEYVASARQDLLMMRHEINNLEEYLMRYPDDKNSLEKLGKIQEEYEHQEGFNFENELKIILIGMGFTTERYHERLKNFSGGEKNRASLAKILAGQGNLLLLDEPTNHLDLDITCWLEEYLTKTDKNYIIVSHDRAFLNNTVDKIWEINNGKIDIYTGGFEKYLKERSQRKQLEKHYYQHQQKEIKRIEDFIRRNMAGQKTKQAQSKLKYLKKIKRLPSPKIETSGQAFQVKSDRRSYAHVLEVANLDIGYGDKIIADQIGFDIYRGDKIGIIGPNGSGKTTLLKTLIGEITPVKGEVKLGNNVSVAYFDQELTNLESGRSVLENLWMVDPLSEIYTIRSFLARFGFFGEDVFKPMTLLSGGEKTKLSLARLLYHPANFIIFDEPTNHLDIISREALEDALIDYDGSLLMVSHDRYFLDKVVNKIIHLRDGGIKIYDGNYSYFKERTTASISQKPPPKETKSKTAYLEFKEKSKRRARLKKDIENTQNKIIELEKELETVTKDINHKIPQHDWEKLQQAIKQKKQLEETLLLLYDKLEKLQEVKLD